MTRARLIILTLLLSALAAGCNLPNPGGEPEAGTGRITGRIWHDQCVSPGEGQPVPDPAPEGCVADTSGIGLHADGRLEPGEPGIAAVQVSLGLGTCPSVGLAEARTDATGAYDFENVPAGVYCVSVDPFGANADRLQPGQWTFPPGGDARGVAQVQVDLSEGELAADIFFGWDYADQPPYTPPEMTEGPTAAPAASFTPAASATPAPQATETATPTVTPTPTQTATATPPAGDPRASLGAPTWQEDFADANDWALYEDDLVRFELGEGELLMTAFNANFYTGWMLSWRSIDDFYIEMSAQPETCSGRDAFGLMFRAESGDNGYEGYLYGADCDGNVSLRTWDGEAFDTVRPWTPAPGLAPVAGALHRLGVWAEGSTIKLYVDGAQVAELGDTTYDEGIFGVFVSAAKTENFTVRVPEMAYWDLP